MDKQQETEEQRINRYANLYIALCMAEEAEPSWTPEEAADFEHPQDMITAFYTELEELRSED